MPGHLQKHHQESSQSGEQVSCKGGTVELVDCMDEAKFGRPECRLIEDALEQFTLSYDHLKVKEEQEAGEQVMMKKIQGQSATLQQLLQEGLLRRKAAWDVSSLFSERHKFHDSSQQPPRQEQERRCLPV